MTTFEPETVSSADPINGWTPNDLTRAKQALESQISRLRRSLADSTTTSGPEARRTFDKGEDEVYLGTLFADIGAGSQQADNSSAILKQCEHALKRINDGRYGICDECAHPIDAERLRAIPRATQCARCP